MMIVTFKYFDKVEWRWMQAEISAINEEEAEIFLRENAHVDTIPYSKGKNSLTIVEIRDLHKAPSFFREPYSNSESY